MVRKIAIMGSTGIYSKLNHADFFKEEIVPLFIQSEQEIIKYAHIGKIPLNDELESSEIYKASLVEGINLDNALTRDLALFRGFFDKEHEEEKPVIIINALVDKKERIKEFVFILKESGLDIENEEIIRILTWEVESLKDYL